MDSDPDEKRSPLGNMNALYEWLTIWHKEVSTEKRSRDDEPVSDRTDSLPRKRVVLPTRANGSNNKNTTYK
jgi:hypothetical protein